METKYRLTRLMCKVSDAVYKKHQELRFGITPCCGKLNKKDIEELNEDVELLKYFINTKDSKTCDINKLIETLT